MGKLKKYLSVFLVFSLVVNGGIQAAEAKKKNHRPTLSFCGALKNKKKLTIKESKKVYVKGIAKDREDGNLNKKVKVKVSKPKGGKYKRSGRYIKFINSGRYKITLSVKDSNKATKSLSRTILVKEMAPEVIETPTVSPTETITPTPTIEPSIAPSVEPTVSSEPIVTTDADFSEYGTVKTVTVDGIDYKILENPTDAYNNSYFGRKYESLVINSNYKNVSAIGNPIDNNCKFEDYSFLQGLGKMKIIDEYGADCSKNICLYMETLSDLYKSNQGKLCYIDSQNNFYIVREIQFNIATVEEILSNDNIIYTYDEEKNIYIDGVKIQENTLTL